MQHRHDTMLTATSMIIGTKSQSFPSPLSTSIDFDNLMATSSSCCPTIYRNQSSFRQFVWRNKLDFGDIKCIAGACLRFAMERTLKIWKKNCNSVVKMSKKMYNVHAISDSRQKKFAHYLDQNWKMFSLHESGRIEPFSIIFYELVFLLNFFAFQFSHFSSLSSDFDSCLQDISHFKL